MSNIYGGDEVNSLVLDMGSYIFKAGYGGDDMPKALFPSAFGYLPDGDAASAMEVDGGAPRDQNKRLLMGTSAVNFRRDNMEIRSAFDSEGLVSDWDAAEQLWSHAFKELKVNPSEFGMMLGEPTNNSKECREKTTEIMFEKFKVPALYMAKNAVLSAFATAKQTALVVDAGHESTTVAAVQDGYLLSKSVTRSQLGGQALSRCILAGVKARGAVVRPRFALKRTEKTPGGGDFSIEETPFPNTHPSFRSYHIDQIAHDLKESVCKVHDSVFEEGSSDVAGVSYELPDGQEILVGPDRSKVPELLFQPELISSFPLLDASHKVAAKPLHSLILDSINHCDVDTRKELYAGVVLTGGSSLMPGLRDRLEKELSVVGPQAAKIKVSMPINTLERRFSVWLGGSILSSLGSFQSLWMSKKEYEEYGSAIIHRKAP